MKPLLLPSMFLLAGCFFIINGNAQKRQGLDGYLSVQYDHTLSDRTIGNNPWGMGAGFQLYLKGEKKIFPMVDISADAYLEDDKLLRVNADNTEVKDVNGMLNLLAGISIPVKQLDISVVAGPSLINGYAYLGIKPSLLLYFSPKRKWYGRVAFLDVWHRDVPSGQSFTSLIFSLGLKLF